MNWKPATSDGTKKERTAPINLTDKYTIQWKDYSNPEPELEIELQAGNATKSLFKYMFVEVR